MRLALLGSDQDSLLLVRWAVQAAGHTLVAAYTTGTQAVDVGSLARDLRLNDNWEELLSGQSADAVIIASSVTDSVSPSAPASLSRGEKLKRLIQAGVPAIVITPACESIVGFEIEMIRRDLGGVIIPFTPGLLHPALDKLQHCVAATDTGPIGRVEQIIFERDLANRSREAILFHLPRDIALIRRLTGLLRTVTASEPARPIGRDPLGPRPQHLPTLHNLSVTFSSDEGLTARWSVGPSAEGTQARLVLVGERGKAILTMPDNDAWSLDIAGDQFSTERFDAGADVEHVFSELSHSAPPDALYDDGAWLRSCRDQEAAEAVDRSLLKGRTIELFHEEHTEAASFKGIMAMGGCLLLVLAICVLLLVTLVEGLQLPLRNLAAWRLWPLYLLMPIGAFLLLQFLGLALGAPARDGISRHTPMKAG